MMSQKKSLESSGKRPISTQSESKIFGKFDFSSVGWHILVLLIVLFLAFSGYGPIISSSPSMQNSEPENPSYPRDELSLSSNVKKKSIYKNSFDDWISNGSKNEWEMGSGDPDGDDDATDGDDRGPSSAHSGSNAWFTDIDDNYSQGTSGTGKLIMWLKTPLIDTSGFSNITLDFWDWLDVEGGSADYCEVYINSTTDQKRYNVSYFDSNAYHHNWTAQRFYLKDSYEGDKIRLNFSFYADSQFNYYGWAIDDIFVNGTESGDGFTSVIYQDDFDDWDSGGQVNRWQLGAGDREGDDAADNDNSGPKTMPSSPHGWATNLTGSYEAAVDPTKPAMWLSSPIIDTQGYTNLTLEFREWLDLGGKDKGNYSITAYSLDDDVNYSIVKDHYGNHTWKNRNHSLDVGLEGDRIRIYFSLYCHSSVNDYGWSLDDIYLNGTKLGVDSIEVRTEEGKSAANLTDSTIPVGYENTYHAASFNSTYGYIESINVTWNLDNRSGGELSKTDGFNSTYKAGLEGGNDTLSISYNSNYTDSVTIQVESPTVDNISIRNASGVNADNVSEKVVPVGYSATFHAASFNDTAGFIDNPPMDWAFEGTSGGSLETGIHTNVTYTAGSTGGDDYLNLSYQSHSDSLHIIVQDPTIDSIEIRNRNGSTAENVSEKTVPVGHSETYYAAGFNSTSGFIRELRVNWSFDGTSGGNLDTGKSFKSKYRAGMEGGTDHINITYSGKRDHLAIKVKPPNVDYIQIRDEKSGKGEVVSELNLKPGQNTTLYAASYNRTSGFLGDLNVDWVPSSGIVELSNDRGEKTVVTASENGTATIYAIYGSVENSTDVNVSSEDEFILAGEIEDIVLSEDFGVYQMDLRNYIPPGPDDRLEEMYWTITGINRSIISVSGDNRTGNHIISFISKDNKYGHMESNFTLVDSEGDEASQRVWINVTSVNDAPTIGPTPDLFVRYGDPYRFNYSPYINDVDDERSDLSLDTDDDEYTFVSGLEVTYTYPEEMLGEERFVRITVSDGDKTSSRLIEVTITSNYPPEKVKELPDLTLQEGEFREDVFDLDDYIKDPDNDSLYYTYGFTHLNITIDEDDHTVNVGAEKEWTGTEEVTFRAEDPIGAIIEQTIEVTVIPVNDPPVFLKRVDPIVIRYNTTYTLDLSWYVSDPDNSTSELSVYTSDPDNVWVEGLKINLRYPETLRGEKNYTVPLTIYVSDGLAEDFQSTSVKVTDNYAPDLKKPLPDIQFNEDEELNDAFDLDDYFVDVDSETIFYISGNDKVNVDISEKDHTVDFSAPKNWNGREHIMIRGTDDRGGYKEDYFYVTVLPVNDPPRIREIPTQNVTKSTWIFDISEYIYDVDDPNDTLELFVNSTHVEVAGQKLLFDFPLSVKNATITITVSDGELYNSRELRINIKDKAETEKESGLWLYLVSALPIGTALAAFVYLKRQKEYTIEDVFLIHESGVLIKHTARTLKAERDEDILAGMFTAVQNFVKDAFAEGEKDTLKRMDYGDKTVLIHKGNHVLLAMFFKGGEPDWALDSMKSFVEDIEERYEGKLEDWSGDHGKLTGVEKMMNSLQERKGKYEKGDWKQK